jgi:hypothetical protein
LIQDEVHFFTAESTEVIEKVDIAVLTVDPGPAFAQAISVVSSAANPNFTALA